MPKYKITTTEGTLTIDADSPENAQATAEEYLASKAKSKATPNITTTAKIAKQPSTSNEQELRPADFPSKFRTSIGGYLPEIPPMLFGIGGNIAGGLLGSAAPGVGTMVGAASGGAVGTGIGELLKYSMQKSSPELFGGPSEQPFWDAAKNVSLSAILDTLAFGPGYLTKGKPIKDVLINKFMRIVPGSEAKSTLLMPEGLEAVGKALKAGKPITVGELTGKPLIEDVFQRDLKQQMIKAAKIEYTAVTKPLTQIEKAKLAEGGAIAAKKTAQELKLARQTAYNAVDNLAEQEGFAKTSIYYKVEPAEPLPPSGLITLSGQPIPIPKQPPTITEVRVPGPIEATRTKSFLDTVRESLNEALHGETGNLPPDASSRLQNLESKLKWLDEEYIQNPITYLNNPRQPALVPVLSYKKATDIRQALNEVIGNKYMTSGNPRAIEAMKAMRSTLDKDIEESLGTKWSNSQAGAAYKVAKDASDKEASTVYNEVADNIRFYGTKDRNITAQQIYDHALSDPELANQYVKITKRPEDLRGAYLKDLIISHFKDDQFTPREALVKFVQDEQNGLLREFMSQSHISDFKQLLREAQIRIQNPTEAMATALQIRKYGLGLLLLTGGLTSLKTGEVRPGMMVGATGLSLIFGVDEAAKRILLNPKYTKLALQAIKSPATSEAGKYYSKLLMGAMRGVTGMLQLPSGEEIEARVDKDGNVKVVQ